MSKLAKPLIFILFLLSIASLVLGSMLYGKREEVKGRTQKLEASVQQIAANIQHQGFNRSALQEYDRMDQQLNPLNAAAKAQFEELNQTKTTLGEVRQNLEETSATLAESQETNEQLDSRVRELETQMADTLEQLEQARVLLAQRAAQGGETPTQGTSGDMATLVEELNTLQTRYDALEEAYEQAISDPLGGAGNVVKSDVEGKVLVVKPDWNFVVIDVGFQDDLQNNVVLLVHHNKEPVGKIRISRVERHMSVAEIITRWGDRGVATGDVVLSPAAGS